MCTAPYIYPRAASRSLSKVMQNSRSKWSLLIPKNGHPCPPPPPPPPFSALNAIKRLNLWGRSECRTATLPSLPHTLPQNSPENRQYWADAESRRPLSEYSQCHIYHFHPSSRHRRVRKHSLGYQSNYNSFYLSVASIRQLRKESNYRCLSQLMLNWVPDPLNVNSCWLSHYYGRFIEIA